LGQNKADLRQKNPLTTRSSKLAGLALLMERFSGYFLSTVLLGYTWVCYDILLSQNGEFRLLVFVKRNEEESK